MGRRTRTRELSVDAGCVVAGGLLPLAFAPFGVFPVAFVSLAALFATWQRCRTPGRAFLRGWLFGAGAFGVGWSWIYESFAFSDVPSAMAVVMTVAVVAYLALFPAILGWVVARLVPGAGAAHLLAFYPAGWALSEWLRGWVLTGVPWLELGHAQVDAPASGWLPVIGVFGTSALVAFVAGALAHALAQRRVRAFIPLAAAAALWGAGAALALVEWTRPAGDPIEVAIVQGNVPQDQKWRPEMRAVTLDRYAALTREHLDADLVVWPETAMPGFFDTLEDYTGRIGMEAAERGSAVLSGALIRKQPGGPYLNAVVMLGSESGVYAKRHLVPFGEFVPFLSLVGPVLESLRLTFSEFVGGPDVQEPILLGPHVLGVSVCYEIAFAREVRRSLPEAALLVTVSNDAWFGESIGPHQHFEIARARAAETGRWLVRATNTGVSAVVSPSGEIVVRLPQFEIAADAFEVVPMRGATPYVRLGDLPIAIVLLTWLAAGIAWSRRASRSAGDNTVDE